MPESSHFTEFDEERLNRLFGTVEEIEAENERRKTIYPPFHHEKIINLPGERAELGSRLRRIAHNLIDAFSHDDDYERYESD